PCTTDPKPSIAAPIELDIRGALGVAPNDGSTPVTCKHCSAASGAVLVSDGLQIVFAIPSDKLVAPRNPFPSVTQVMRDRVVSPGSASGVVPWHPRLLSSGGSGEISMAAGNCTCTGLVEIRQVGTSRVMQFWADLAITSVPGSMTGTAEIHHTNG